MDKTRLQAVIFDVDGTLADTERDGHRLAFNAAFREAGLPWEWDVETYGRLLAITGGKERIAHFLQEKLVNIASSADFDDLVANLHRAKTQHYLALLARGTISLRPGVVQLVNDLRSRGIRLAIATTTTLDNVIGLFNSCGGSLRADQFEIIGAGDVVRRKKPQPDIYSWVLDRLQLAPESCLAIEDSEQGLAAAIASGVPCVVTPSQYTAKQRFQGAIAVVGVPLAAQDVLSWYNDYRIRTRLGHGAG